VYESNSHLIYDRLKKEGYDLPIPVQREFYSNDPPNPPGLSGNSLTEK